MSVSLAAVSPLPRKMPNLSPEQHRHTARNLNRKEARLVDATRMQTETYVEDPAAGHRPERDQSTTEQRSPVTAVTIQLIQSSRVVIAPLELNICVSALRYRSIGPVDTEQLLSLPVDSQESPSLKKSMQRNACHLLTPRGSRSNVTASPLSTYPYR